MARRQSDGGQTLPGAKLVPIERDMRKHEGEGIVMDEFKEIIQLPKYDNEAARRNKAQISPQSIKLPTNVTFQLRTYVSAVASKYRDSVPFHNFEHARYVATSIPVPTVLFCAFSFVADQEYSQLEFPIFSAMVSQPHIHIVPSQKPLTNPYVLLFVSVTMSVVKLLGRIVAPKLSEGEGGKELHDHTYVHARVQDFTQNGRTANDLAFLDMGLLQTPLPSLQWCCRHLCTMLTTSAFRTPS